MKAIFQNEEIGDPAYDGLTFGGYALTTPLLKADYPGLRAIRLEDGTVILAEDLPDSYTIPPAGGGGGGDHPDSDHADAFSPLAHTHAAHADSDHDDRFSQLAHTHAAHADSDHDDRFALIEHDAAHSDVYSALAHTHAAHADSDHDDRFSLLAHAHAGVYAPVEHDSTHDDRFSLLAHTHAAHADSDHDDRFALIAQGVPAGGATGEVLAKSSGTNYATVWQAASAPAPQPLDWLTDVNTAGQASTNVLTYNGSSWVPAAIPAHADTDHDDRFSLLAHTHAAYPLGVLGYAQTTTAQTGIGATTTNLTGLSVAVTVGSSRRIKVTGQGSVLQKTSAGVVAGRIREGTTSLDRWGYASLALNYNMLFHASAYLTPTAGAHTYLLSLETNAGTVDTAPTAVAPMWILVEDIGPV